MFMTYWVSEEATEQREVKCPKGHRMREDWGRVRGPEPFERPGRAYKMHKNHKNAMAKAHRAYN